MFSPELLKRIATQHFSTFKQLEEIESILTSRFVGLEKAIKALILSIANGEPLLLVGPPGTAKSRLIRAFCGLIGLIDEKNLHKGHQDYFEYLLTPFTEPGELFGYYDISKAKDGNLVRNEDGMMQKAKVIYLDEIFNGSSAILNSILSFMNERIFHDRGTRKKVSMQCLFAATNQIPEKPELRAIFDRLVLRCQVENIPAQPKPISDLLQKGWMETYAAHQKQSSLQGLLENTQKLRQSIQDHTSSKKLLVHDTEHQFYKKFTWMVNHIRQFGLSELSNRRLIKISHTMLIHAMYEWVKSNNRKSDIIIGSNEFGLIPRFFLDRFEADTIEKIERAAASYDEKH